MALLSPPTPTPSSVLTTGNSCGAEELCRHYYKENTWAPFRDGKYGGNWGSQFPCNGHTSSSIFACMLVNPSIPSQRWRKWHVFWHGCLR